MPDSVLPPPSVPDTAANDAAAAARTATSNDKSWAGWAISSFTNKLTTANGEIQSTANGSKPVESNAALSASVPRSSKSTPSAQLDHLEETPRATFQPLGRSFSDQIVPVSQPEEHTEEQKETDDFSGTWGGANDVADEGQQEDADPFGTVAEAEPSVSKAPAHKPAPVPYDDGGEPDFAGWLAAQSKAKAKRPLPKGLNKSASSTRGLPLRPTTTSKAKRIVPPPKPVETKPKNDNADDDWGGWD